METITTRNEYLRAANKDGVAVFEGVTTWCPQCKAIKPKVEELIGRWGEKVRWYTYNVEQSEDIAQELGVSVMPTFTIFRDGDLEGSVTGAKPDKLEEEVRKLVGA